VSSVPYRAAALLIVLGAALLRFWGLGNGLPHPLTRPDEEVLLNHLVGPARGDFDLQYAVYPSLFFYLMWLWVRAALAGAALLGLVPHEPLSATLATHPEWVLLAARALSATAATLTVPLLMALARETTGRAAALLAGALLATNVLHVRDAHAAKPDALLTLGVTAALTLMAGVAHLPRRGRLAALGAVIGLATGIKYPALLLLAPAWVACVLGSRHAGWRRWVGNGIVPVAAAAGLVFVATSPYLFLNPETRRAVLGVFGSIFPSLFPGLVPKALPAALLEMGPERHWWSGYAYHLTMSLRHGVGLLPTVLALPALVWGCLSPRPIGRIAVAWVVVYAAVHGLSPMLLARYMTPMLPALFLLEAGLLLSGLRRRGASWQLALGVVAAGALLATPLANSVATDRLLARPDTRLLATEWLAAHTRPGDRVLLAGTVFWAYGEPLMPPGVERLRLEPGASELPAGVRYVVGHDHPTFASRFDPAVLAPFAARLRLEVDLDPFVGPRDGALFEEFDAYYVPLDGFGAVERTGPRIRIYAVTG
jgi:4-amino-4-deoxy-L-arabinose transferase-like glycosyltransferase